MKTHPILFSDPMIKAIVDGRKTQTRRIRLFPNVKIGDLLWVRESWRTERQYDDIAPRDIYKPDSHIPHPPIFYEAGNQKPHDDFIVGKKRASIFLPRWASRLTLKVKDIRVQRLRDISEEDAKAEGVKTIEAFQMLWNDLNVARGYGWDKNPWVTAYSFNPIFQNIDDVRSN